MPDLIVAGGELAFLAYLCAGRGARRIYPLYGENGILCNRSRLWPVLVVCLILVLWACGGEDSPTSSGRGRMTGDEQRFFLPNGAEMKMVWIEPGTFQMGSPDSEGPDGRCDCEGPVHEVVISRGFWLGKYEVTQGQWEAVMGTRPWTNHIYGGEGPSHPAVYISWNDVQDFIDRLNAGDREELYRLPTEAEWEYACRAGTTMRWSFGDDRRQLMHYAWYWDNTCDVDECYGHAVGLKRANFWGLHDMHGNVYEWVQDRWGHDYYNSSPRVDPLGPSTTVSGRVIRGGSFLNDDLLVRSAHRDVKSPGDHYYHIGFRLVRIR